MERNNMPKNNKKDSQELAAPMPVEPASVVQNTPPKRPWTSFEQCWHACVKNGTPLLMVSCKAHLKAMGWLHQPNRWIEGMRHFGIKVEK